MCSSSHSSWLLSIIAAMSNSLKILLSCCLCLPLLAWANKPHSSKPVHKDHPVNITQSYGRQLCNEIGFHCMKVQPTDTWKSLWPNYRERDVIMRLNRSNVALKYRKWVVVPKHLKTLNIMDVAPFPKVIYPPKEKVIVVNLGLEAYGAYNAKGHLVFWGPASPGQAWCADINMPCPTPTGAFRIFKKEGKNCYSNSFPVDVGGSPMPYCMFFHGGAALHGAEVPGIPSTHGCVGINNNDARWLNQDFVTADARKGTIVLVFN